jgi:uncharacterized protein YjiS (DUF1127 family)
MLHGGISASAIVQVQQSLTSPCETQGDGPDPSAREWREQMAYITGNAAPTLGLGQRIAAFLERSREARKAREIFRRTHDELSALSDRDLADLGISRANIAAVAREAARMG